MIGCFNMYPRWHNTAVLGPLPLVSWLGSLQWWCSSLATSHSGRDYYSCWRRTKASSVQAPHGGVVSAALLEALTQQRRKRSSSMRALQKETEQKLERKVKCCILPGTGLRSAPIE